MSNKVFVISDQHFGHKNILSFSDSIGKPIRQFSSVEEMNEHMVNCWNSVVTDTDIVYNLGDVVFAQSGFEYLKQLKGRKILLCGNHERHKIGKYLEVFEDVKAYKEYDDMILCHIPIHTSQLERYTACVHGHLHTKRVMNNIGQVYSIEDPRYFCVSVEQINYTPILLEEVRKIFKQRGVIT